MNTIFKVCNGEGEEICKTVFESSCTTKYVEKQPGIEAISPLIFNLFMIPSVYNQIYWEAARFRSTISFTFWPIYDSFCTTKYVEKQPGI